MFPLCIGGKSAMCWKGNRPVLVYMNSNDAVLVCLFTFRY